MRRYFQHGAIFTGFPLTVDGNVIHGSWQEKRKNLPIVRWHFIILNRANGKYPFPRLALLLFLSRMGNKGKRISEDMDTLMKRRTFLQNSIAATVGISAGLFDYAVPVEAFETGQRYRDRRRARDSRTGAKNETSCRKYGRRSSRIPGRCSSLKHTLSPRTTAAASSPRRGRRSSGRVRGAAGTDLSQRLGQGRFHGHITELHHGAGQRPESRCRHHHLTRFHRRFFPDPARTRKQELHCPRTRLAALSAGARRDSTMSSTVTISIS